MEHTYSLNALSDFVQEEAAQLDAIGLKTQPLSPSEFTLQKILGFSKQFSVRPSSTLGRYEQHLN